MNANTNGRLNKVRHTPTLTVAPVTRAIRAALAISFTLLALGGSGAAFAQTCVATTATTETCEGAFTNTVPGTFFTPVADLTLVLGDSAHSVPTSVIPAAGLMGIDANWGGNVGVTSYADITTVGATGIFAYGSTSATVTNNGAITTNVTAPGAEAMDISAYGDVTVVNTGPVKAYSTGAYDVTAVSAYSSHGAVTVENLAAGTITATAQDGNAIAVNATAYGDAYVSNVGAITASSVNGTAVGVLAQSYDGIEAFVNNSGSITATSTNGQAVGVLANGDDYAIVVNSGSITAASGQDEAIGVETYGNLSLVYNSGSIMATSTGGTATGVVAQASGLGLAKVVNSGIIQATSSYGQAAGVLASAAGGYAKVSNYGSITATENGKGNAIGIGAYSQYGTYVTNTGSVTATTTSTTYGGTATGIAAETNDTGVFFGTASVTNSGSITATSNTTSASYPGAATGVLVSAQRGSAEVTNSSIGSIAATAQYHNNAIGVSASSAFEGDAYVNNAGSISASTQVAQATGILAQSHYGTATVINSGDINALTTGQVRTSAYATGQRDYAQGIIASSGAGVASGTTTVTNSGGITAQASFFAEGVEASARYGAVAVTNTATGAITVTGDQFAIGIGTGRNNYNFRYSNFADNFTQSAVINNAGSISATATGNPDHCGDGYCQFLFSGAVGIGVFLNYGNDITVTNSGKIAVSVGGPSYLSSATGIQAITDHGDVTVDNSGHIAVSATAAQFNWGIRASTIDGAIAIDNSGSIAMSAVAGYSPGDMFGIAAETGTTNGGGTSTGGGISIVNSGDISIAGGEGYGISARSNIVDGDPVKITNSGDITVSSDWGIFATTYDGSNTTMLIDNSGRITAGVGIEAQMEGSGATMITNSGDISAVGAYDAFGVTAQFGNYDLTTSSHATIDNSGSISTNSEKSKAEYGAKTWAGGVYARTTYGDVTVANTGSITANAKWDYVGVTGAAISDGVFTVNQSYSGRDKGTIGNTTVTNGPTGSITSTAEFALGAGAATANGIYANQHISVNTYNGNGGRGYVSSASGITVTNAGTVSATALIDAAASGSATATGVLAVNKLSGFATVTNDGSVLATATNSGAIVATDPTSGTVTATGISVSAPTATAALDAGGYVGAIATGASGTATGLSVIGTTVTATGLPVAGTVTAGNAGTIRAVFYGAGKAYGAMITSAGDVTFTNSGNIHANAAHAVTVDLTAATTATLINTGLIVARPTVLNTNGIAVETSAPNAVIQNSGTITGKLR
ncbi:hypothetical protein, partial [Dyella sp. S184]|uniref:beta strand repeat-containing protein n=1 Tax=Dyella sp. S184 TaxID=1641862 RepID=UPI001C20404C